MKDFAVFLVFGDEADMVHNIQGWFRARETDLESSRSPMSPELLEVNYLMAIR